jgi:hypothetical protein
MESDPEIWVEFEKISDVLAPRSIESIHYKSPKERFPFIGSSAFWGFLFGSLWSTK